MVVSTSAVVSSLVGFGVREHIGIVLVTCGLFACLYAESLLLETAHLPDPSHVWPAVAILFSFMFATSMSALASDAVLVKKGNSLALGLSFWYFLLSAILQWLIVLPVLPGDTLFRARFQLIPGQAAHLKNTGYFLLLVILLASTRPRRLGAGARTKRPPGRIVRPSRVYVARAMATGRECLRRNVDMAWHRVSPKSILRVRL
jgi:hypothetical protein